MKAVEAKWEHHECDGIEGSPRSGPQSWRQFPGCTGLRRKTSTASSASRCALGQGGGGDKIPDRGEGGGGGGGVLTLNAIPNYLI